MENVYSPEYVFTHPTEELEKELRRGKYVITIHHEDGTETVVRYDD